MPHERVFSLGRALHALDAQTHMLGLSLLVTIWTSSRQKAGQTGVATRHRRSRLDVLAQSSCAPMELLTNWQAAAGMQAVPPAAGCEHDHSGAGGPSPDRWAGGGLGAQVCLFRHLKSFTKETARKLRKPFLPQL